MLTETQSGRVARLGRSSLGLTSCSIAFGVWGLALLSGVNSDVRLQAAPSVARVDGDNDGIYDAIDPNPGANNDVSWVKGDDYELGVLGSGRVINMVVSTSIVEAMAVGNSTSHAMNLSRQFFEQFRDVFDFLLLISDQNSVPQGTYFGINFGVRNTVRGLGKSIFDRGATYGSEPGGSLKSVIHLTSKTGLIGGPSLHEIMHQWGNFLVSIPSSQPSHWGFSSVGGQLGGWKVGTLVSVGNGEYTANNGSGRSFGTIANGGNGLPYGELELYLMGLISPDGLPDIQIAEGAEFIDQGHFKAAAIRSVSMQEIVAIDGQRVPDHTSSQKRFQGAVVVLSDHRLSQTSWAAYDLDVFNFSFAGEDTNPGLFNFWEATGGRTTIEMNGLLRFLKSVSIDQDREIPHVTSVSFELPENPCVSLSLTVALKDDVGIDKNTLDDFDIKIRGPKGNELQPTLNRVVGTGYPDVTAIYSLPSPIGGWRPDDTGEYSVDIRAEEISDHAGKAISGGTIASVFWDFTGVGSNSKCSFDLTWLTEALDDIASSPVLAKDSVYVISNNRLAGYSRQTGALRFSILTSTMKGSPMLGPDETVYIATSRIPGRLEAIDGKSGFRKWIFPVQGSIEATPTMRDDIIFIGTGRSFDPGSSVFFTDGRVIAVDSISHQEKWQFRAGGDVLGGVAIGGGGNLYFGTHLRWEFNEPEPHGRFYALDAADGSVKWTLDSGIVAMLPTVGEKETVFVGNQSGRLLAINGNTGELLWSFGTGNNQSVFQKSSPVLDSQGRLFVAGIDGTVYALDQQTGALLWTYRINDAVDVTAAVGASGSLYIGSQEGQLYSIDTKQGELLWTFQTGAALFGSPVIGNDGVLYFGTSRRSVTLGDGTQRSVGLASLYAIDDQNGGPAISPWPMFGQNSRHTGGITGQDFSLEILGVDQNGVRLKAFGKAGKVALFEYSEDLKSWRTLTNLRLENGSTEFNDSTATGRQSRFYRISTDAE